LLPIRGRRVFAGIDPDAIDKEDGLGTQREAPGTSDLQSLTRPDLATRVSDSDTRNGGGHELVDIHGRLLV